MTFFSSWTSVMVMGSAFPLLSLTVTFPVRGSVWTFSATSKTSFPLVRALVSTKEIQDLASDSTSTVKSVLYWTGTSKIPPSEGIFATLPTIMVFRAA